MPGIAEAVITALGGAVTSMVSGLVQNRILGEGQAESRKMYVKDLMLRSKELAAQEKLTRDQMRQSQRQFSASLALQKEQLGLEKDQIARKGFHDQATTLTGILDKNEQLKTLYFNRLAALRG